MFFEERVTSWLRRSLFLLTLLSAAAKECGFEILPHPPYSPDLTPSDYYLFPKLKYVLRGKRFETNNDVIEAVDAFLRVQKFSFFYEGIAKLEDRWNK